MSSTEAQCRKLRQIQEVAEGWGKLLAREAFPGGPGLDVSLIEMEEFVATASKAMVRGAIETLTGDQAKRMPEEAPCPICGRSCGLHSRARPIKVRGGEATLEEPVGHCATCRRDFFPSASGVES
jgi:hypothetical protein